MSKNRYDIDVKQIKRVDSKLDLLSNFGTVGLQFGNSAIDFSFGQFLEVDFLFDTVRIRCNGKGKAVFVLSDGDGCRWLSDCFIVVGNVVSEALGGRGCLAEDESQLLDSF